MHRADAVRLVMDAVTDELVVCCNGMIGREAFTANDREASFYMIGSMGLALSIGLGVAMTRPDRRVLVLDGDGNVLMGAGVLASVAAADAKNLRHVVLDNEAHGSTGGQRTITDRVRLETMATAAGYRHAERVPGEALAERLPSFLEEDGPSMLLVKVEPGNVKGIARVSHEPPAITDRFAASARARS
jgi:thiamine pyrophosphate-dependent acetolactate synthase large subunit-like protein